MRTLLLGLVMGVGLASAQTVGLQTVAENLDKPLFMTYAPDGSGRMFIVEQGGRIRILQNG
ncbi:PQQ-dependent sugar dehydrogenase, partial [Escherichia coli]|nr:PQQ-dependent sugar dehydrogenase [Escherichia coli]